MATKERDCWRVRWREHGRRFSQTFPEGTSKKTVDEFERKVRLGLISRSLIEDCPFFKDYAVRYLKISPTLKPDSPRAQSTIVKDISTLENHLLPAFGDWRLCDIKPADILDLQAELFANGEGYAAQSVRNIISLLSSILRLAVIEECIEYNPCSSVPRVARDETVPAFWSFADKDTFLCGSQELDFELFQLAAFATDTGPRIGELEGLLGDCLNLREGYVEFRRIFCTKTRTIVNRTKNRVPRRVYLSPEIMRVMSNKQGVGSEERVFPLNFNRLSRFRLTPMCERLGVRRLTAHGWRHTFASHLLMLGRPPKDVQTALGHKKIATTLDTYGHLLEEYTKGITDGMNSGMRWVLNVDTKVVPIFGGATRRP